MHVITKVVSALSAGLLLVACGGGGSSSGGGAQAFNGSQRVTLSSPGLAPGQLPAIPISISVVGDNVTITDVDQVQYKGKLKGDSFSATGSWNLGDVGGGVICGLVSLTYNGVVDGALIRGNISGSYNCTLQGVTAQIAVNGPFQASAVAAQMSGDVGSKLNAHRQVILKIWPD